MNSPPLSFQNLTHRKSPFISSFSERWNWNLFGKVCHGKALATRIDNSDHPDP
uniref:Uncharacterized protein n=1 Tax=Utricularia reniformis TaxID=192314 RepID=A0A1Y0AZI8_9LAMI|nr:hypothetical protein AEK19_MT0277 [Utricularia reniformis]ART30553.1 hypothetical protein AEK19_MT0277 [Utricularia reniformis]